LLETASKFIEYIIMSLAGGFITYLFWTLKKKHEARDKEIEVMKNAINKAISQESCESCTSRGTSGEIADLKGAIMGEFKELRKERREDNKSIFEAINGVRDHLIAHIQESKK